MKKKTIKFCTSLQHKLLNTNETFDDLMINIWHALYIYKSLKSALEVQILLLHFFVKYLLYHVIGRWNASHVEVFT